MLLRRAALSDLVSMAKVQENPGVTRDDWRGSLNGKRRWRPDKVLVLPTGEGSTKGGSRSFPGKASDGREYHIKTLNNPQGARVPITEQIVGRAGRLIGAPVCAVKTILIPKALVGWEFWPGLKLERGCAHGSLIIQSSTEPPKPEALFHREKDDNASRHAYYFALYDWCWGGDVASLIVPTDDHRFYSHDHGWFLPPEGNTWSEDDLVANVDVPRELSRDGGGLDMLALEEVAVRLEQVTRRALLGILSAIPEAWPVSNQELEAVGFFLERRAPQVAKRLRNRLGGGS